MAANLGWSSGLRGYDVKIDPNFYSATSNGEKLFYAEKFLEAKDRSRPTTTQNIYQSKRAYDKFLKQKELEEKAELIRLSLRDDEYEAKMAMQNAIPRVEPKPEYSQRLLNRVETLLKYRKPVHMNCGYANHELWSRKSSILEEYLRAQIKGKKFDNLDSIHVLNLMRENYKINIMDVLWADSDSNPDNNQIFRFSSFQGKTLKKDSVIKLEFDALTLTLVNDFLSLQKKIRQNHGVLPLFIKDNHQNPQESDYRVEATLTAITKEGFLHIRPLCTAADFVLAMHELQDPLVLEEGFINVPHILHVNTERSTEGYYRYHYHAKEKSSFQYLKVINIPSERKELKNYIYSLLSYTDYYFDASNLQDYEVPRDLYEFAYRTLLSLNLLFHPANEIITHITMDIEICEVFSDIKKLSSQISPPHLLSDEGRSTREFTYRIISFSGLQVQKCLSADRRHAICSLDGMSQAFLRDFHKYFQQEWQNINEGKPFTSSLEAVLPSSMVVAQEVAGKLHRKITAKRLIDGESSSSEEEVDIEPEEVLPLKEDNKEIIEKPTSAAALRRKSKDVILQAKETAQLLAKHHKAQLEKQKAEKDKDKKWMKERDIERDKERETEAKAVTFTGIAAKPLHGRKSNAPAVRKTLISQSMEGRASFRASIESDYEEKLRIAREEFVDEWLKKEEAEKRKKGQPKFNLIDYHESMMTERAKSPQLEILTMELPFSSTSPVTTVLPTRLSPQTVFEKPKSPTTMAKDILLQFVAPSSLTDQPQIVLTSDLLVPSPLKAGNVDKEKEALRLQVLSRPDAEENENAYEYASKVDLLKLISGIDNLPQRIKDIKLRKLRFLQKEKEEKLKQKEEEESKQKILEEEMKLKKQVEEKHVGARLGSPAPSSRASTAAASKRRKAYQEKSMEEVEKLLTTLLNGVDMIQANMHTELSLANTVALPISSPTKVTKSKIPSVIGSPQKTLTSTIATNESFGATARSAFSPSRSVQSSPQKNPETHSDLYNQLKAYLDRLKFLKLQRFIKRRRRQETLNKSQLLDLLFYYQSLPESHWKELEKQLSKQDLYEKSDEEIAKEEEEQLLSLYIPTDSTVEESMNTILGDYMNVQEVDELIRRRNEEMKLKEKEREKERTPRKTVIPQESIRRSFIQPGADAASLVQRKNSIMSRGHTSIRMSHLIIDGRILLPDGLNITNSQYEEYRPNTADATTEKKSDSVAISPTAQMEMINNLDEGDDRWEKMTDTLFSVAEPNCMDEIHDLAFNNAISATATEDINNAKFFRQPSISEYDFVNGEEREGEDDVSIKENVLDRENRSLASKIVAEEDIDKMNDKEQSYRSILYTEDQINFQHNLITEEEQDHPEVREEDETVFVDEDLLEILQHLIAQLPALTKVMRRMSVTRPPTSFQSSLPPPQTREGGREGRAITPAITAEIVSNPLHDNDPLIRNSIRPTTSAGTGAPTPVAPNHPSGTGNFSFHYQNRIDPVLGLHQNVNEDIKKLFLAKPPPINSRMNTPAIFYKNHQRSPRPTVRKHRVTEPEATKKNLKAGAGVKFGLLGKTMAITPSIQNATARIELKIPQPDLSSLTDDNQDPSSSGKIQSNQFDDSYDDYYHEEFQDNNNQHILLSQLEQHSDYQLYTSSLEGKGEHLLDQVNLRQSLGEYNPTMSTISHELWSEQFKQALIPQSSSPPYLADPTGVTSEGLNYQTIMDYYGNTSSNLLISGKSFTVIEGSASPSSPSRTASPKNEKKKMAEDSFNEIPTVRRSQQNYQHLPLFSPSLSLHSNSPNETPSFAFSSSFHLSNSPNQRNFHGEELNLQSREEDYHRDSTDYTSAIAGDPHQEPFYRGNIFRRDEEVSPISLHGPSVFSVQSSVRVSPLTLKETNMIQSHHEAGSMLSHIEEKTNHLDTESMNTLLKEIRGKKFVLPSPKRIPPPRSHYSDNTVNSISNMKKMNHTERVHGTSEGFDSHDIPGSTRRSNRWNYLLDYLETTFENGNELNNQDSGEHSSTNRELKPAIVSIIVPEVQTVLNSPPPSATKHQTFRPNTASQAIMRQPNSSSSSAAFQSPNRRNRIIKDKKVIESLPTNENQEESNKVLHITGFLSKVGGQEWNKPSSFQ